MLDNPEARPCPLTCKLACTLINRHRKFMPDQMPPPSPATIPFRKFMDIPFPFKGNMFHPAFSRQIAPEKIRPLLAEGEWVGYYSYFSMFGEDTRFDPPMTGIHFAVTENSGYGGFIVNSSGVDSVGAFFLNGHVDVYGVVEVTKSYTAGYVWHWRARMTPFGIMGCWGNRRDEGFVWIWKREWSV